MMVRTSFILPSLLEKMTRPPAGFARIVASPPLAADASPPCATPSSICDTSCAMAQSHFQSPGRRGVRWCQRRANRKGLAFKLASTDRGLGCGGTIGGWMERYFQYICEGISHWNEDLNHNIFQSFQLHSKEHATLLPHCLRYFVVRLCPHFFNAQAR